MRTSSHYMGASGYVQQHVSHLINKNNHKMEHVVHVHVAPPIEELAVERREASRRVRRPEQQDERYHEIGQREETHAGNASVENEGENDLWKQQRVEGRKM